MRVKLSPAAAFGIAAFAAFTIFITWRAKKLERTLLERARTPALVNKVAPDFALASLDGRTISPADYHGKKKLIVSFWASWCGPCRMEMPVLRTFYERHHKTSDTFELLAISIDDNRADAASFAAQEKLPFPVLLDLTSKTANAYGVDGIPTLFIISESGKVIYGHAGFDGMLEFQLARELGFDARPGDGGAANDGSSH